MREKRRSNSLGDAIEGFLLSKQKVPPPNDLPVMFEEPRGVFVTLNSGMLRGCIGYPYPTMKLKDAIIDAAISAAVYDYRFPPVNVSELDTITIEVTILTQPERIHSAEEIMVGKHGVIIKKGCTPGIAVAAGCDGIQLDATRVLVSHVRESWTESRYVGG